MPKTKTTFRYAVSPDCVRHISGLSLLAKTLYIDILKLSSKKGYCWASNSYFSGLYKVHPMTVSKEIAELKKQGIIVTEMVTGKGVKTARKIVPIEPEKLQHSLASRLRTPKCIH